MKMRTIKTGVLTGLLTLCMVLSMMPASVFADGVNYIDEIEVTCTKPSYKAGDTPQAVAKVVKGNCTVAYEYWREIYQQEEGGVWSGTGRYWYSDPEKMAALAADKQITQFEAGHHYSYNIVLTTDSGYFLSGTTTKVSVDGYDWGVTDSSTNLEIKEMSTKLYIYSPYSIDIPASSSTVIKNIEVGGAVLSYNAGDTPRAAAYVNWLSGNMPGYEVAYESWEEADQYSYWFSDEQYYPVHFGGKFTSFEEGKTYCYSILLKAKDGWTFATADSGLTVTVNGCMVDSKNVKVEQNGSTVQVTGIATITPTKPVPPKEIEVVEVNNVTVAFRDGDKPVFTGKAPDGAGYTYRCEWWEVDSKTGVISSEFGSGIYENHITVFETGKTYHYGVYLVANDGYKFTTNTKLKINGEFVSYKRAENDLDLINNPDDIQTMWVYTDLTMTPQTSGTTSKYKIIEGANGSWMQSSDDGLKFVANGDFSKFTGVKVDGVLITADKYTAVSGSTVITLKKDYLSTLSAGKHTLSVVYNDDECSAEFEVKAASAASDTGNSGNNSNTSKTTSPKTGDTSNLFLWFALLLVSGSATIGTAIVHQKKKYNR